VTRSAGVGADVNLRGGSPSGSGRHSAIARAAVLLVGLAFIAASCSSGPILANAPAQRPLPPATPPPAVAAADPQPVVFPADDGPHDRLTEWWYYTGHLKDAEGHRYGFEFVIFRAERGDVPVSWASHLALTDEAGRRFVYGQRGEVGPQVDLGVAAAATATGFDLAVTGLDPSVAATPPGSPWTMVGANGHDHIVAALSPDEARAQGQAASFGLDLQLVTTLPPVLHRSIGWIDFGPAGSSYYYSRPRLTATGQLTLDGHTFTVDGTAWFDHQWGNFIAVGAGGWDWFAVNLADGTDLTLSLVRDAAGGYPLVYGTLAQSDGSTVPLTRADFTVEVTGSWTSPRTGARYPAGWRISVPGQTLQIDLAPAVAEQELDTRPTTGVVYWEGSQTVRATRDGRPVNGEAYVELTGYGPAGPTGR
jgi:predicted secreted hydrolase